MQSSNVKRDQKMTPNGIHGNCPAPTAGSDPHLAPVPSSTGGGQASPQGISGPIPLPSPRLGLAAVNELRGDPGAPCTQGMCPKCGLDLWGGGGDLGEGERKGTERRERDRGRKREKEKRVKKRG